MDAILESLSEIRKQGYALDQEHLKFCISKLTVAAFSSHLICMQRRLFNADAHDKSPLVDKPYVTDSTVLSDRIRSKYSPFA